MSLRTGQSGELFILNKCIHLLFLQGLKSLQSIVFYEFGNNALKRLLILGLKMCAV